MPVKKPMERAENLILADSRIEIATDPDVRLFRNNTGALWDDKTNRMIRYGLCTGSSDLIGWRTVTITSDMVGKRIAVFVAGECKAKYAYPSAEQKSFIRQVRKMGGYAGVFRSPEQLKKVTRGEYDPHKI